MVRAAILFLTLGIPLWAQQSFSATTNLVAFVPPAPWTGLAGAPGFLYGIPELWTYVETPMHATDGTGSRRNSSTGVLASTGKRETPIAHGVRLNVPERAFTR